MWVFDHRADVDLEKALMPEKLDGVLATFDSKAHKFSTKIYNGGAPVSLVGYDVRGYFTGEDGLTWGFDGEVVDGVPEVVIPICCTMKPGRFTLTIKIGSSAAEMTIRIIRGQVVQTVEPDLWKDVRKFTAIPDASGKVVFTVDPYVDVQKYNVYEWVGDKAHLKFTMNGILTRTENVTSGMHRYYVVPVIESRDGAYIEGNRYETGVQVQ